MVTSRYPAHAAELHQGADETAGRGCHSALHSVYDDAARGCNLPTIAIPEKTT